MRSNYIGGTWVLSVNDAGIVLSAKVMSAAGNDGRDPGSLPGRIHVAPRGAEAPAYPRP
ncbi:MAG: hypothetical protein M3Y33_11610 [Actinomycetota bacterium]|nr:hypothetical protein [Actinomycetota bacterium]